MNRDLVIIEAPGKLKRLYGIFEQIGLHADICATIGHVLENPDTLRDLGVVYEDGGFRETMRQPRRADSFSYLKDSLKKCAGRILIATDDDQEGHVIANDVADLIVAMGIRQPVYRLMFAGLDRISVLDGLNRLQPMNPAYAVPGTARRIADRLIAAGFSDFDHHRPVGRVQSALLGMIDRGVPHSHVNVKMPAADGGRPFLGALPVFGASNPAQLIAEMGLHDLPPAPVAKSEVAGMATPPNYGDLLLDINTMLGMDIEKAADLLQQMYESGDISYPRTLSKSYTLAGSQAVERLARLQGIIAFKRERLPVLDRTHSAGAHEAIRLMEDALTRRMDLGKPLKLHASDREAVLAILARRSIEAGIPVLRDTPDLSGAPEWARGLEWSRDTRRTILPWRLPEPSPVVWHNQKAEMVRQMMASHVGRPSTWASHAGKFISRDLVDHSFRLTGKGRDWLEHAPKALVDLVNSSRIEAMLDDQHAEVGDLVKRALYAATGGDQVEFDRLLEKLEVFADGIQDENENRYRPAF